METRAIWESLGADLRRYIRRRVADDHVADDLLQETFVRIHRHLTDLERSESVSGWVYRIAHNVINDHFRRRRPEGPLEVDPVLDSARDGNACGCHWLNEMIDELPEPYREAVRLVEQDGIRQQDLAERLGISLSGAKSRVQRGRVLLRRQIEKCCALEIDARGKLLDFVPKAGREQCRSCGD